jgi:hypothetical protein
MVLKSKILFIIIPLFLVIGVVASVLLGFWDSKEEPMARSEAVELNANEVQTISGSSSLLSIGESYGIPIEVLYDAFSVSDTFDPALFMAKDLGKLYEPMTYEIGTEALESFVAMYNNLTYELIDVYLPSEAVQLILAHNSVLSEDQKTYLSSHTLLVDTLDPSLIIFNQTDDGTNTGFAIKGPTTIQEVLDAGISQDEFEEITGYSIISPDDTVKDFCVAKGLTFSEVKLSLEAIINP